MPQREHHRDLAAHRVTDQRDRVVRAQQLRDLLRGRDEVDPLAPRRPAVVRHVDQQHPVVGASAFACWVQLRPWPNRPWQKTIRLPWSPYEWCGAARASVSQAVRTAKHLAKWPAPSGHESRWTLVLPSTPWGEVLRSALFVRAVLAVAAAFLLSGTLLAAPATSITSDRTTTEVSARAPGCLPRCWTAISFNPQTRRSGWTQKSNWGTKAGAMSSALGTAGQRPVNAGHARACVPPGKRDSVVQNGCVAVAWRIRGDRSSSGRSAGPTARRRPSGWRGGSSMVAAAYHSGYSCSPRRF